MRLAAAIALAFTALGAAFVAAEYAILSRVFDSSVALATTGEIEAFGAIGDVPGCAGEVDDGVVCSGDGAGRLLSETIGSGFLAWSLLILAGFVLVSAVAAWLIARGTARRLGEMAEAVGAVSERDLSRRLRLRGPRDEVRALADRIDSTLERLDAAFARQERFLGNASYELRTPLATGRAALEAPLTQGRLAPEVEPSVRRAIRSYLRMEEAVEGLLLVARVGELGDADVEAVPIAEVLARTAGDIEGEARERGVRVREGVRPGLAVCGSAPAVDVAVRNILLNAVRHNIDGGFVRIDVERAAAGSAVAIRVENSGARYEAEEALRLLEPFNRGVASRKGGAKGILGSSGCCNIWSF
ncbi:two-component system, sensor protein [Leifsonia xyli subsp. xyli str. CTCB07]|uniref:histidine kinase n=1 Tax=Leifsonia xyli subsp. xyli (strain CTCB07) TaxID=281090 RepID=Q6ADD6_LEIXX|nr:two-component system, sensor protein [Leifsonia xyli subsp. xyli str. CTCB07]